MALFKKCAVAFAFLVLPMVSFGADDIGELKRHVVTLDVIGGGVLASLVTALVTWLSVSKKQERARRMEAERMPPLGEEAAKTYATKGELTRMETNLRDEIDSLRTTIRENDGKAEQRAEATHRRIDSMIKSSEKSNRSLGILIGIMSANGSFPANLTDSDGD